MVEQAFRMMCQEGNATMMEAVLGMSAGVESRIEKHGQVKYEDGEEVLNMNGDPLETEKTNYTISCEELPSKVIAAEDIDNKDVENKVTKWLRNKEKDENDSIINGSDVFNCDDILNTKMLFTEIDEANQSFKCDECGIFQRDGWNLKEHIKTYHANSCERCYKTFMVRSTYAKHIIECWYKCEQCDYKCAQTSRFKQHVKSHMREAFDTENLSQKSLVEKKRYNVNCDICGKTQRDGWGLKRHIQRFHKKEHKCNVCSEEFVGFENWSIHVKDCFFTCDQCDFKDKRLRRYESHVRRHMKEGGKGQEENESEYTQRITILYK